MNRRITRIPEISGKNAQKGTLASKPIPEVRGNSDRSENAPLETQNSHRVTPLGKQCECGCGRLLDSAGRGTPRKYALPECRQRAYRRRTQGS